MSRTVVATAILALFSGCVSPSERVPVNRGLQSTSRFSAGRGGFYSARPVTHPPGNFFAPPSGGNPVQFAASGNQVAQADADQDGRWGSSSRRDVMPRFFPGLFGHGQGDPERLAKAKVPNRSDRLRDGGVETVGHDAPVLADQAGTADRDSAVRETQVEVEKTAADEEAPLLPVGIKVEAYPIKPSPTLPSSASASAEPVPSPARSEAPAGRDSVERTKATATDAKSADGGRFLPIPGVDTPKTGSEEPTVSSLPSVEPEHREAAAERPRLESRETNRPTSAATSPDGRFRVTPKQGGGFPLPDPEPRRGPISRLFRRWRGDEAGTR